MLKGLWGAEETPKTAIILAHCHMHEYPEGFSNGLSGDLEGQISAELPTYWISVKELLRGKE